MKAAQEQPLYGFQHWLKNVRPEKFYMTFVSKKTMLPMNTKQVLSYPEGTSGKKLYLISAKGMP